MGYNPKTFVLSEYSIISPPGDLNCPCVWMQPKINEDSAKFYAAILVADDTRKILVPSKEEWVGIGLLERDDELKRRMK